MVDSDFMLIMTGYDVWLIEKNIAYDISCHMSTVEQEGDEFVEVEARSITSSVRRTTCASCDQNSKCTTDMTNQDPEKKHARTHTAIQPQLVNHHIQHPAASSVVWTNDTQLDRRRLQALRINSKTKELKGDWRDRLK